jgi:hypothetical protein
MLLTDCRSEHGIATLWRWNTVAVTTHNIRGWRVNGRANLDACPRSAHLAFTR